MSKQPPKMKKPASSRQSESPASTPEGKTTTTPKEWPVSVDPSRAATELRQLIVKISEQVTDSGLRSIVDRYLSRVSRPAAYDGEAHLPRSVKRHAISALRSTQAGYGNLICFYIGTAILAYYQLVLDTESRMAEARPKPYVDAVLKLRQIAEAPTTHYETGTDAEGYALLTLEEIKQTEEEKLAREERRIARVHGGDDVRPAEEQEGPEQADG